MLHRYIKLTIDPATAEGWAKNDSGQQMYYKDGKVLTGWQTIDGKQYFFDSTGSMQTGWKKDDKGNWYYLSANGAQIGWKEISKKRYYFTKEGIMVSGKWLKIDSKWYCFYTDGTLAVSTKIDGYEVDKDGVRKTK
jgi:glucan-binding YG repeat protein